MKKFLLSALFCGLLFVSGSASAQRYSVQTNILDWATLFTFNVEGGVYMSQHFSAHAGIRYNPWSFHKSSGPDLKLQQTSLYLAVRYWPWYVNSGFWIAGKAQYQSFHLSGFRIPGLIEESGLDATGGIGPGLTFGYAFQLNESLNLEVGLGAWVPYFRELGLRVYPDSIALSLVYVF